MARKRTTEVEGKQSVPRKKKAIPPPLPPSVMGLLNKKQVGAALGLVSTRNLDEMISEGLVTVETVRVIKYAPGKRPLDGKRS